MADPRRLLHRLTPPVVAGPQPVPFPTGWALADYGRQVVALAREHGVEIAPQHGVSIADLERAVAAYEAALTDLDAPRQTFTDWTLRDVDA